MARVTELQAALQTLGLSEAQARLYLALAQYGELRIQEIVSLSHLPRSSVYEAVRHLTRLGIAEEVMSDNFKKIRACPLGVMRHDLEDTITTTERQIEELGQLEDLLGGLGGADTIPARVRYYKGRAGARQVLWNTLKATDMVYVYSEWGRQQYVGQKFYENFAAENHRRNLQERVLVNLTPAIVDSIKRHTVPGSPNTRTKLEDIRALDSSVVQIKGDTMMYNHSYAQLYLRSVAIHGFEIESQEFVATQRSIFETLWATAKPVIELLE